MFRPSEASEMTTAFKLLVPEKKYVNGVLKKTYKDADYSLFYANFKTYGGTDRDNNGVYSIIDTGVLVTYFRPDIKSDCRVIRLQDNAIFEIINEPENIEMRNQFLKFKVQRIKGNA